MKFFSGWFAVLFGGWALLGVDPAAVESALQGEIFTAKHQRLRLERYAVTGEDDRRYVWRIDGREIGRGREITLARSGDGTLVELCDAAALEEPGVLLPPPANPTGRPVDCEAGLEWFFPEVIYDDEVRDFFWELSSKLPTPCDFTVQIIPERDNPIFPAETRIVRLGGRPLSERFSPGEYHKEHLTLRGAALTAPLQVEWVASIPNLELTRQKLHFVPVAELPELTAGADGRWRDGDGALVIPVLHRKLLSEQRTLELPIRLGRQAIPKKRVLIVGEDFNAAGGGGKFSEYLSAELVRDGYEPVWLSWFPLAAPGGWNDALPTVLNAIRRADVDQVLIVPPGVERRGTDRTDTEWVRLTDLLLQAAWSNPAIRQVTIGTPDDSVDAEARSRYLPELRKMLRGSDTRLAELAAQLATLYAGADTAALGAGERSSHPVQAAAATAAVWAAALQ